MKVAELIKELTRLDENLEVRFEFASHDYWRTNLVAAVVEATPEIVWTDSYHDQFSIPKDELCEADIHNPPRGREVRKVIVLRGYKR